MRAHELAGRYGRLNVLRRSGSVPQCGSKASASRWLCQCDCGKTFLGRGPDIARGKVNSCGCLRREQLAARNALGAKQNKSHPLYRTWSSMRSRCNNPNDVSYARYGGVGIRICERWGDFWSFVADVGERPEGMTLDRYPNNAGNYEPGNVRWATASQQARNRCRRVECMDAERMDLEERA